MISFRFDMPFEEALEYFRKKGMTLTPEGWRQLWQQAHSRAFTVARVTEMDVLQAIRDAVDEAMEAGSTVREFKEALGPILERKGWLAPVGEDAQMVMPDGEIRKRLTGWRMENLYRTNMAAAYSTGRYKQQRDVAALRPYWQYKTVEDPSVRPAHAAMHNKVYHVDHPVWDEWYPPNGFGCRCYVKALSARLMEQRGLTEQTQGVSEHPDEGWQYNVGASGLDAWQPDLTGYPAQLRDAFSMSVIPAPEPESRS